MISAKTQKIFTVEEYLDWEAHQGERFEFHDGAIVAMAGGTTPHTLICENFFGTLFGLLRRSKCRPHGTEQKIHVEAYDNYYYPDISIVCGKPEYTARGELLNPVLIGEVLSPSTHLFDRNDKFDSYKTLPSLMTYLLIAQDQPRIEVFTRDENGEWSEVPTQTLQTLDSVLKLNTPELTLSLTDIYLDVFPILTS